MKKDQDVKDEDVKSWVARVRAATAQTSEVDFALAIACASYPSSLDERKARQAIKSVMEPARFSKCCTIGGAANWLTGVRNDLPTAFFTIYELAKRGEQVVRQGIADGIIHPEMRRSDIAKLDGDKDNSKKSQKPASIIAVITEAKSLPPERTEALLKELKTLSKGYEVEITTPTEQAARARADAFLRKEVQDLLKKSGSGAASARSITKGASLLTLRNALESVGLGNRFEQMLAYAYERQQLAPPDMRNLKAESESEAA